MTRSELSTKAVLLATGIGLSVAALAGSLPAAALRYPIISRIRVRLVPSMTRPMGAFRRERVIGLMIMAITATPPMVGFGNLAPASAPVSDIAWVAASGIAEAVGTARAPYGSTGERVPVWSTQHGWSGL